MDEELRSRIRIQYVDSYGEVEAGVDGGGLFKDFMENLVKEGFNPEIGLFRTTPEQKLYPSPAASSVVPNAFVLFEFLGKMLGKAMYEVSIQLGTHADFTRSVYYWPPCFCPTACECSLRLCHHLAWRPGLQQQPCKTPLKPVNMPQQSTLLFYTSASEHRSGSESYDSLTFVACRAFCWSYPWPASS